MAETVTTALHPSTNASDGADDAPSLSQRRLNISNRVYLVGAAGAIVFGALGLAASFFIYRYSSQVSNEQRREVLRLQAESSTAKAEAAKLAVQLEREKTARAAFEAQFSWRVLDEKTRQGLISALSGLPHTIAVEFPSGDPEASFLALQFMKVFEESKWKVIPRSVAAPPLLFGIDVPESTDDATKAVMSALRSVGIVPATTDFPAPGFYMGNAATNTLKPDVRLIIGSKPTPEVAKAFAFIQQPASDAGQSHNP